MLRENHNNKKSMCVNYTTQEHRNHLEANEPAALITNKRSPELCIITTHMNPKI